MSMCTKSSGFALGCAGAAFLKKLNLELFALLEDIIDLSIGRCVKLSLDSVPRLSVSLT